jgi:hypothetical protein
MEKTVKIRPAILAMEIGETISFPLMKVSCVRVQTSEIGLVYKRKYTTKTDRVNDIISVKRLA